jgi:FlaG/FlaF family flagellin (archaellin)
MNSYIIATVSMIAAAVLIAATIAVPISCNSAYALVGQRAQQGLSAGR